jgi:hypothetical protein
MAEVQFSTGGKQTLWLGSVVNDLDKCADSGLRTVTNCSFRLRLELGVVLVWSCR